MSDDFTSVVLAALSDIQSTMVTREHLAGLRNDLADQINNVSERFNRLAEQISRVTEQVIWLTEQAERLTEQGGRLEKQQTGLRVDLMARMDRMQATLDQVKSDITVNFANTDRVDRKAQSAQDEIRLVMEIVGEMVRSVRRLETRMATLEEKPST